MRYTGSVRFATFLAPSVLPTYRFICEYIGRRLGIATELVVGESFAQFERGEIDAGFICGLPYVQLAQQNPSPVELLAAPVLQGGLYGGRPLYYSDVIVRRDSPYQSFQDLRDCVWSYNDPDSHSGYGITRYKLVQMRETKGFFGRVVAAGFHQESVRLVCEGEVNASAIDSQVLALAMRDRPEVQARLRIIESLGPSTIQPVVAARRLPSSLKADISEALIRMADDHDARTQLAESLFERFVPVNDAVYDDIREMLQASEAAGFTTVR